MRRLQMKKLIGKNIIVTGGTSGIGKASALKLAENGTNLVISGRNEYRGQLIVEEIKKKGGQVKFIKCDVTKKEEVDYLFDIALSQFQRIDSLFNNAGIDGAIAQ